MTELTTEEEAVLRPEYEKYCADFPKWGFPVKYALTFDEWWREAADNAKDRAKHKD